MEGTTEPILVVIGNPVAGNPAQFALERALRALELDWRVLSFDVVPDDVGAAVQGFAVTGIVGVLVARELTENAGTWNVNRDEKSTKTIDCFYRNDENQFVGEDLTLAWLQTQIDKFKEGRRIWIGGEESNPQINSESFENFSTSSEELTEAVSQASVIIMNPKDSGSLDVDLDDWPENDGQTLIISPEVQPEMISKLRELGYLVIGQEELRVGSLQNCITRWTGQTPLDDVLIDAIEEYLSV